jgi:pyridoxal phosphate enzyme (YggS family)
MSVAADVKDRLGAIRERVEAACERSGRPPSEVHLLGASKRQSLERMRAAWEAGLRVFGENRVQEAEAKIPQLPEEAEWHLIGPLQSNKVNKAVELFRVVHSIDRLKIGRALDRAAGKRELDLTGFLEVNLGEEESKHGFSPRGLAEEVRPLADLEHLSIVGLMAIPPWETETELVRGWFRRLRELRDELCSRPEWQGCPGFLSMGMSSDYELAVEEGATHLRIGTALFGPRPDPSRKD